MLGDDYDIFQSTGLFPKSFECSEKTMTILSIATNLAEVRIEVRATLLH
jgi:hypothetical protein